MNNRITVGEDDYGGGEGPIAFGNIVGGSVVQQGTGQPVAFGNVIGGSLVQVTEDGKDDGR
jgi:hypothetical protein